MELTKLNETLEELKTKLEGLEEVQEEKEEEINSFDKSEYVTEDQYDEMLDDCYGEIEICGMSYSSSYALRELDPTAYRCGLSDYADKLVNSDFEEFNQLEEELEEIQEGVADLEEQIEELESEIEDLEEQIEEF